MITSKNRIHRRTLLRGAGGIAIGLPFLDAMLRPGRTHAADATPMRLVVFYSPGGTLLDKWRPTGATDNFTLSSMMSPLTPMKDRLLFVDGLNLSVTEMGYGHPHARGMGGVLTGQPLLSGTFNTNQGNAGFAAGPSIDQVIAGRLSTGLRFKSLELSSGWSTGISAGGQPHPGSIINYGGSNVPIPPATDPLNTFSRVFAGVGGDAAGQAQIRWDTSILDSVMEDYRYLSAKLGPSDRAKLDAHLQMISRGTKRPQGDGQGQLRGADRHQSDARVLQRRGGRFDQPRRSRRRQGRHPGRRQSPGKGARDDRHPGRRAGLRRHPGGDHAVVRQRGEVHAALLDGQRRQGAGRPSPRLPARPRVSARRARDHLQLVRGKLPLPAAEDGRHQRGERQVDAR